jgi:hypothetical protein
VWRERERDREREVVAGFFCLFFFSFNTADDVRCCWL